MKRTFPLAFLAAALLSAAPIAFDRTAAPGVTIAAAEAATTVDISVFFTTLSPYGSWIPSPNYNYVWVPTQVDADWSPYTNGHWVYTDDYGWYFVSDEPFAAIVYHYGRWGYDPLIGWYWVPGTQWAPAWVAWRQDADDIGWAPLPPQGNGYATDINVTIDINAVPEHYWRFVPANSFLAPQLRTVFIAADRQPDIYRASQPAGVVVVQNNIVVNNVINLNFIEQKTNQKVTPAKVDIVTDPKGGGPGNGGNNGNGNAGNTTINAFIAALNPPSKTEAPAKVATATAVQAPTKGQAPVDTTTNGQTFSALTPNNGSLPAGVGAGGNGPGGNGPTGTASGAPAGAGPGTPAANPKCTDPTYAKNNPKDCAVPGTNTATVNPNAGGTPSGNGPGGATGNGPAGAGGNKGTTTATVTNPQCADPTYAKDNPKTCATTPAAPGGAAAAGAAGGATGAAGAGAAGATGTANLGNGPGSGNGPGNGNGPAAGNGPATGQGNATATVNAKCDDPTYAKNNPKTCAASANANVGGAGGGPAAGAGGALGVQGAATTPVAPLPKTPATPNAGGGAGGNANTATTGDDAARCSDPTFAKNNPKTCATQGAGAAVGAAGGAAGNGNGPNGPGNGGADGRGGISIQGNTAIGNAPAGNGNGNANANKCTDPTFAKANPQLCVVKGGPGAGAAGLPGAPGGRP